MRRRMGNDSAKAFARPLNAATAASAIASKTVSIAPPMPLAEFLFSCATLEELKNDARLWCNLQMRKAPSQPHAFMWVLTTDAKEDAEYREAYEDSPFRSSHIVQTSLPSGHANSASSNGCHTNAHCNTFVPHAIVSDTHRRQTGQCRASNSRGRGAPCAFPGAYARRCLCRVCVVRTDLLERNPFSRGVGALLA